MVGSAIFYAIVFGAPFYLRIIVSTLCPLAADASGAALAGHYRRWQVGAFTGRVAGVNTYSTTKTSPVYGSVRTESGSYQRVVTGITTSTSTHTTLLLVDRAGQQRTSTLTNFGLEVFNDQIVSLCTATRGGKNAIIAVLNHSTRRSFTGTRQLYKVVHPHERLVGLWAGFSLLLSFVFLFIGLGDWLILAAIFFGSLIMSQLAGRRQVRRFARSGISPLWTSTAAAAGAL
jgi:hypothetical protein